jgi:hypothetical protein
VIAATAGHAGALEVVAATVATLVVFWLAHVYAQALAHHLQGASRLRWSTVAEALAEERPMLLAPLLSLLLLLAGAAGLLEERTAIRLALWAGVLQLVGWGVTYARRQGWSWPTAAVAGVLNGILVVFIVLLEVLLH